MKIAKKKPLPKKVIFIAIALLAVAALVAFYLLNTQLNNNMSNQEVKPANTVDYNEPTEDEKAANDTKKDEIIEDFNKNQNDPETQPSGVTVSISRLNQTGSGLSIGTVIDGATSGNCEIAITKSGQPAINKTFPVIFEATSAFCKEAFVPLGEFSSGGEWNVRIVVKNGDKSSEPATQTITMDK